MERRLSQQIQDLIDLLQQAEKQADHAQQTLRAELAALGLSLDAFEEDIEHILHHLRDLKALVERHEDTEARDQGDNGTHTA